MMSHTNKQYRADIDGLRAIAVLSVVLYHVGFNSLSGGYIGVDIFFVISGYLITNLLISEAQENGSIDFRKFYIRRIRRIIPALFFTLLATSIAAISLLTSQRLMDYGASLLHAVLSISNISFFATSGYFDNSSEFKPLLHTWSLGVEEQFYLVWPLIVAVLAIRKISYTIAFSVIGIISIALAGWFIDTQSSAVFYLMPFRMFEFGIGALLVSVNDTKLKNPYILNGLLIVGLGLIGFSLLSFDSVTVFPGVNALWPCIGAALCIYSSDSAKLGTILKNRLLVGVGLISYSLYLVHWPLIVFYKYYTGVSELTTTESVSLLIASLLLAIFMYFWVEKPFRRKTLKSSNALWVSAVLALSLSYLGASLWANDGWPWRPWSVNTFTVNEINNGKELRFKVRQEICVSKGWDKCDNPVQGKINALIIGDSHSVDALNALYSVFPTHDFSMSQLGGCPPHKDIGSIFSATHLNLSKCKVLNQKRHDLEYLNKYDYLAINVLLNNYQVEHLGDYLTFLSDAGIKNVIVMGGYYTLQEEMHEIVNRVGLVGFDEKLFAAETPSRYLGLKQRVEQNGYFFLSVKDAFCSNEKCHFFDENNVPFTYDKHHLSFEFSSKIAIERKQDLAHYLSGL